MRKTSRLAVILLGLLAVVAGSVLVRPALAQTVPVGAGSYTTELPSGSMVPSNENDVPLLPARTADVTGPTPTTDWWTHLVFKFRADNPYSNVLAAQPLNLKARTGGLGIGTGTKVYSLSYYYAFHYQEDFIVGLEGMAADETVLGGYSDWTVTAHWEDASGTLDATMGHGLPFVYFTKTGGTMQLQFPTGVPSVWYDQDGVLGFTVNGKNYGAFAPTGSVWVRDGIYRRSDLAGGDYLSVACLPDATTETLEFFRDHAYAFVTDTRVDWEYDEAAATVATDFQVTTEVKEGTETRPLLALYRHQWLHADLAYLGYSYDSMCGEMKLVAAAGFRTEMDYPGILPILPAQLADSPGYDPVTMDDYLDDLANQSYSQLFYRGDTYYGGKDLGIVSAGIRVADQAGRTDVRDYLLTGLKAEMEDWLSAPVGEEQHRFYYNDTWGSMYGYRGSFATDRELNDHHFHWGYFVMAAATIAMYDAEWAAEENWGGMVNLLIRDADSWLRDDPLFPFLRCFDPYAGHSWASGHGDFGDGNNQESSSESMQFNAAVALWGSLTGNDTIRDLGAWLYTTEMHAVEQYWFDVDDIVFPSDYAHNCVGMVWGTKATHETWFSAEPEMIHGINFLPITPVSLYLGRHPDYVEANYDEVVSENGGQPDDWPDIMWEFLALADPAAALGHLEDNPNYSVEGGETRAHTYYWLHALSALGQLDPTVTADVPHFAVFAADGGTNYAFCNPNDAPRTIRFSDGHVVVAEPGEAGVDWLPDYVAGAGSLPSAASLAGVYPNPFNPRTTIVFDLPRQMGASLHVYDLSGRLVRTLVDAESRAAGTHEVVWNGRDDSGRSVASGAYVCRLETGGRAESRRMVLIR